MSIVKKLDTIDYDKDIMVIVKPMYGSGGNIQCTIMDINLTPVTIFKDDVYKIKKSKRYTVKSKDFDMNGCFLCFNIDASPAQNKTKCEIHITLLQGTKKLIKFQVEKETSMVYHLEGRKKET